MLHVVSAAAGGTMHADSSSLRAAQVLLSIKGFMQAGGTAWHQSLASGRAVIADCTFLRAAGAA